MTYAELAQHIRKIVGDQQKFLFDDAEVAAAIDYAASMLGTLPGIEAFWGKIEALTPVGSGTFGGLTWRAMALPENYYVYFDAYGVTASDDKYRILLSPVSKALYLARIGANVAFYRNDELWVYPYNSDTVNLLYIALPPRYTPGDNDSYELKVSAPYRYYWARLAAQILVETVREETTDETRMKFGQATMIMKKIFTGVLV